MASLYTEQVWIFNQNRWKEAQKSKRLRRFWIEYYYKNNVVLTGGNYVLERKI